MTAISKPNAEHEPRAVASRGSCSCSADDLLVMLKWLVGFKCPTDARAIIDAEPIKQAENLIRRYELQHKPNDGGQPRLDGTTNTTR